MRRISRSNPLFLLLALMTVLIAAGILLDDGSPVSASGRLRKSPGKTAGKMPGGSTSQIAKGDVHNIVVVMMENRSFDHLLGWHPTADAMQEGLSYPDRDGTLHETRRSPRLHGCDHPILIIRSKAGACSLPAER
jgi:phospholipase C